MKTLIILRHAKSDWNNLGLSDFDRPLNARGKRDAPRMAVWATENITKPDLVITSTAVRARDTVAHFIGEFAIDEERVVRTKDVYLAGLDELVNLLQWIPTEDHSAVMVVGHNPTMTLALEHFANDTQYDMPTCGLAVIEFPEAQSWKNLGEGNIVVFATPKMVLED